LFLSLCPLFFSGKRVLDWTSRFFFVEMVEKAYQRYQSRTKLTMTEAMTASLVGACGKRI
jgi:hypothetical protein